MLPLPMSVESSTIKYEQWLQERLKPNQEIFDCQIKDKHKAMADDPFSFCARRFTVGRTCGRRSAPNLLPKKRTSCLPLGIFTRRTLAPGAMLKDGWSGV